MLYTQMYLEDGHTVSNDRYLQLAPVLSIHVHAYVAFFCCSVDALLCREWVAVLCHVLLQLREASALQAVLCLMTRTVTERARYR